MIQAHRIPPRDVMFTAYDLYAQGTSVAEIARTVKRYHTTVAVWLNHPERFDPYLDEVAIARAMAGDREVYEHLTMYEEDEFLNRLEARVEAEPYDPKIHVSGDNPGLRREVYWLSDLSYQLGLHKDTLPNLLRRRRRVAAAA